MPLKILTRPSSMPRTGPWTVSTTGLVLAMAIALPFDRYLRVPTRLGGSVDDQPDQAVGDPAGQYVHDSALHAAVDQVARPWMFGGDGAVHRSGENSGIPGILLLVGTGPFGELDDRLERRVRTDGIGQSLRDRPAHLTAERAGLDDDDGHPEELQFLTQRVRIGLHRMF